MSDFDFLLAISHHLLIFALFAVLIEEFMLVRRGIDSAVAARVQVLDIWYGHAVNLRAGLIFADFQNNRQLQLTGDVRLDLDAGGSSGQTGGSGHWWRFSPRRWIISPLDRPLKWAPTGNSQ